MAQSSWLARVCGGRWRRTQRSRSCNGERRKALRLTSDVASCSCSCATRGKASLATSPALTAQRVVVRNGGRARDNTGTQSRDRTAHVKQLHGCVRLKGAVRLTLRGHILTPNATRVCIDADTTSRNGTKHRRNSSRLSIRGCIVARTSTHERSTPPMPGTSATWMDHGTRTLGQRDAHTTPRTQTNTHHNPVLHIADSASGRIGGRL
jgi:hypothetical protein